ncbi:MAG: thioredoxin family protein [Bacteroidetes bacterium]|nr:thioredoxin family protein [Bacteroidota bacterium]
MKKYIGLAAVVVIALLYFLVFNKSKEDSLKWYDNLEQAEAVAQKEGKPILINFTGSDWCVWCKRLRSEVFSQDDFVNYAKDNLVLVKIDFPEKIQQSEAVKFYNNQLAQRFGVQGFPTIVLLSSSGSLLGVTGYQEGGAEAYVEHIKSYL